MRFMKKGVAVALTAAMVVTLAPANSNSADAAKKPSIKKQVNVAAGSSVKIAVKNATKKAKVKWSIKGKAAKINKKKTVTKGKKVSVTVVGVSKGTATVTGKYTAGKLKKKLTVKVTVTEAAADNNTTTTSANPSASSGVQAPIASASTAPTGSQGGQNATTAPTGSDATPTASGNAEPTVTKTPRPTKTPTPVPTATPTPLPSDKPFEFDAVPGGIPIDVSTFHTASGTGGYDAERKAVTINDVQAGDNSHGSWALPNTIPKINMGDVVTFRVQGYNYGTSGFRFWIGTEGSGGCTPVMLVDEPDENLLIDPALGYPCVKDDDGNVISAGTGEGNQGKTTYNQMAINKDKDTNAFDLTFSFKAGTSQDDTNGNFNTFTLKYIFGGDTSGYINGLVIKNIYYIADPNATPAPTDVPKVADGYVRCNTVDEFDPQSTDGSYVLTFNNIIPGDDDKTPAYHNKGDLYALSDANDAESYVKFANADIPADRSYIDINKEDTGIIWNVEPRPTYGEGGVVTSCKYILRNEKTGKYLAITQSGDSYSVAYKDSEDDECEFELVQRIGEEIEYVSLSSVKYENRFLRISTSGKKFSVGTTSKSTDGRNGSIHIYKYEEPEVIDLSGIEFAENGTTKETNDDGSVTFTGNNFSGIFVKLPEALAAGDQVEVTLEYECEGSSVEARTYLVKGAADARACENDSILTGSKGAISGTMTANGDADYVMIKADKYDTTFTKLTIKNVTMEVIPSK